jgi:hypothetical protein
MKSGKQYNLGGCSFSNTDAKDLWFMPLGWPQMAWSVHAKFYEDWFGHVGSIQIITSTVREAAVLALLMRRNLGCPPLRWPQVARYVHTKLLKIGTGVQAIWFCFRNMRGCYIGIADRNDLWCKPLWWIHMAWYTEPSFMKIGRDVQAIWRFCLRNLNGWNVNIPDRRNSWSAPFKWAQAPWYTYQVSWPSVQKFK